jgi:hypothetical protein
VDIFAIPIIGHSVTLQEIVLVFCHGSKMPVTIQQILNVSRGALIPATDGRVDTSQ